MQIKLSSKSAKEKLKNLAVWDIFNCLSSVCMKVYCWHLTWLQNCMWLPGPPVQLGKGREKEMQGNRCHEKQKSTHVDRLMNPNLLLTQNYAPKKQPNPNNNWFNNSSSHRMLKYQISYYGE